MASHSSRPTSQVRTRKVGHVACACFLWMKGHSLIKTEWADNLCKWFFEDTSELRQDIESFFADEALVNPREFFPKVTEFKRRMYEDNPLRKNKEVSKD